MRRFVGLRPLECSGEAINLRPKSRERPRREPLWDFEDEILRTFEIELLRPFVEVFPRAGAALRTGFFAVVVALRDRAAVEARFLVLPLALFAFRRLSGEPAAALTAPAVVDTTSFAASTVPLAASVAISGADFAASMVVLAGSTIASCVAPRTPSPSSIVAPFRESVH